jgi:eukaryotic-like serine/threonine-protein kinase
MSSLHQHAKDLFLEALARTPAERATFLSEACGTDAALRQEVDSLLAFHSDHGSDSAVGVSTPSDSYDSPSTSTFSAGEIFASRYRMIARIGRGGMGDVWRADDLVLNTPVALKLIHAAGADARDRIANEVRLARSITHPAVCRVFDVGEADGHLFLSMELVQGEDLATLLRRVGRLPPERVIAIGKQLCAGLAALHAQRVLHRDLKPANVLIDDHGRVLITDFGIAVANSGTRRHTVIGTPGYMAPEQLSGHAQLTERTDIYALGLVLYELVVGQHPFARAPRSTEPVRPSTRVSVDPRLERTILKALSLDPNDRPESAAAMGASLEGVTSGPATSSGRLTPMRWLWAGAAVLTLVAGATALWWTGGVVGGVLTEQDTIVLADFTNTTGEPVFDGALKVALAVSLEQSPFLRVFSDDRVQETLRLMGRPVDAPVTRTIAREIAQRQELKALVAGSIARLGRNYVIALEAINAATGDAMARQQVEVSSQEEVLSALGRAVSEMRGSLGESLASIQRYDTALPRATTSSLEALHAYALALDHGVANPRAEAIPHLKRAIELDPNFAMALAFLATVYSNTGQTALAPEFARRAYELRDRVSERERYFIAFRYHRDATQDWDQALEFTRAWTAVYPREGFAFNSLGSAYLRFGQYETSLAPLTAAIRLDPTFSPAYSNLATSYLVLDRRDDARKVLADAAARNVEARATRRMAYTLAFVENDTARMNQIWDAWVATGDATAHGLKGHTLAYGGRIRDAHEAFRAGVQGALRVGQPEVAAQMAVEDAEAHAVVGQCADAARETAEAVAMSRDNFTLERASRAAALCGQDEATLLRELRERYATATFTQHVAVPLAIAAGAVTRRQPARAIEALEEHRQYEQSQRAELWPWYLRGLAYWQQGKTREAADEFQQVLDRRPVDADSQLVALAHLGKARALARLKDIAAARAAYERFFGLWSSADAELAPLAAARSEYAALAP